MSMSNAAEAAVLDLLFLNVDWANVGDAGGLQNSVTGRLSINEKRLKSRRLQVAELLEMV